MKEPKLYDVELYDFPGFYNTWLDLDYYNLASYEDMTYEEWDKTYEITHDNYHKYMVDAAKIYYNEYVELYNPILQEAGIEIKYFHAIASPQYYNFSNDSLSVFITCDFKKLKRYLKSHKDIFDKYVRDHFTSYDGFWSWISNSYNEFILTDNLTKQNHLGAVVQFIAHEHRKTQRHGEDQIIYNVLDKIEPYQYVSTIPTSDLEPTE